MIGNVWEKSLPCRQGSFVPDFDFLSIFHHGGAGNSFSCQLFFDVISGDDGITFPLITLGAVGVISVIGNALPYEFSRMVRLALRGEYESARTIHHKFTELFKLLFVDGNPAGVKAMLSEMGMIQNQLRLPLIPTRLTTMKQISDIVRDLGY